MYLGANRRGVELGPAAMMAAGIREKLVALGHEVVTSETIPVAEPDPTTSQNPQLCHLEPIVAANIALAERVRTHVKEGALAVTLGGDHSIALGSVSGAARARGSIGLIWVDAHGDFNCAETTPSGHIHGMILAALCGYGDARLVHLDGGGPYVDPRRVAVVGARDLDPGERRLLREAGVRVLSMAEIDRRGMDDVMREAIALASTETAGIHASFDLDAVDGHDAPGVGTPVPGGLTLREAHLAMEMLAASGKLTSYDLVEVNPLLDMRNQTAELAVELALSAAGKRIF
jgi:arginase